MSVKVADVPVDTTRFAYERTCSKTVVRVLNEADIRVKMLLL